jgi:hypothetical protein
MLSMMSLDAVRNLSVHAPFASRQLSIIRLLGRSRAVPDTWTHAVTIRYECFLQKWTLCRKKEVEKTPAQRCLGTPLPMDLEATFLCSGWLAPNKAISMSNLMVFLH